MIVKERDRQLSKEGWTLKHDRVEHDGGELALAAVCYATPTILRTMDVDARVIELRDPWPWDCRWDKRLQYGSNRKSCSNVPADPHTYTTTERIDLLVKAGALIAAEVDRLLSKKKVRRKKIRWTP